MDFAAEVFSSDLGFDDDDDVGEASILRVISCVVASRELARGWVLLSHFVRCTCLFGIIHHR